MHVLVVQAETSAVYFAQVGLCLTHWTKHSFVGFIAPSLMLLSLWTHDKDAITCRFLKHTPQNAAQSYISVFGVRVKREFAFESALDRCWVSLSKPYTCL